MKETIEKIYRESIRVKEEAFKTNTDKIIQSAEEILKTFQQGGKILIFGNGGSAADSQHIAAEFIGRFQKERKSLPAIALTTDTSILTSLGNDYSYDIIFARQIEGLGKKGDVAIGISTSGNSKNVIEGIQKAKALGLKTITLSGGDGGKLGKLGDINMIVSSKTTARIQESHLCIEHVICELVESQIT
jgi:D-sedoheptulose 7-phosphate isomerase